MSTLLLPSLVLCMLLGAGASAQGTAEGQGPRPVDLEIPAILRRTPDGLPRAEPQRWANYGGEDAPEIGPEAFRLLQRAGALYQARQFPRALEALYALLELEPDFPDALLVLGTTYFRMRRYGDAALCFGRALERAPVLVGRTQALGHCYYTLGDYVGARDHYARVLAAEPGSLEARRGLALSHLRLGEEDEALTLLEALVRDKPDFAEARYWLGRVHFDRGDSDEARPHARRAIELQPHDVRSWFLWMEVLFDLGEDDEAEAAQERWAELDRQTQELRRLEAVLVNHPERFDLLGRVVELRRDMGDVEGARNGLDRLLATRPPEVDELKLRVFALDVLVSMGDTQGAARAAELIEENCAKQAGAWRRLELYYAGVRDRMGQVRAGRRRRELEAEGN